MSVNFVHFNESHSLWYISWIVKCCFPRDDSVMFTALKWLIRISPVTSGRETKVKLSNVGQSIVQKRNVVLQDALGPFRLYLFREFQPQLSPNCVLNNASFAGTFDHVETCRAWKWFKKPGFLQSVILGRRREGKKASQGERERNEKAECFVRRDINFYCGGCSAWWNASLWTSVLSDSTFVHIINFNMESFFFNTIRRGIILWIPQEILLYVIPWKSNVDALNATGINPNKSNY